MAAGGGSSLVTLSPQPGSRVKRKQIWAVKPQSLMLVIHFLQGGSSSLQWQAPPPQTTPPAGSKYFNTSLSPIKGRGCRIHLSKITMCELEALLWRLKKEVSLDPVTDPEPRQKQSRLLRESVGKVKT